MQSNIAWISGYSNNVSLSDVSDDLTSCKNSDPVTPVGSAPFFIVISTNPFTASANAPPLRSLISCTRLISLFFWLTSPPRAWPTAERRCMTLSANRCAGGQWGVGLGVWNSCSSSMLLIDNESSSSDGGWSKEEGLGGGSQTPSSIQETLWGDWGTGLPWGCSSDAGLSHLTGEVGMLPVLALLVRLGVASRLGLLRTTPAGVEIGGESADWALIRPGHRKQGLWTPHGQWINWTHIKPEHSN